MNEINIHRGRSKTIRVPVIYKDGTACILSEGDYIFFAVKADKDGETLIKKMLSYDSGSYKATLSLIPKDTAGLEIDRYFYDIGVCFSDGNYKDIISWGNSMCCRLPAELISKWRWWTVSKTRVQYQ